MGLQICVLRQSNENYRAEGGEFDQTATKGKPREFWNYLGTKKGISYWVPLFDSYNTDINTLARPEFLAHQVSGLLRITD